jgi:ATP-binding cassette subfamily C protein CydD
MRGIPHGLAQQTAALPGARGALVRGLLHFPSLAITATRVAQVLLLAHAVVVAIDGRTPVAEFAWLGVAVAARAVLLWFAENASYKTAGVTKERLRTRLYERLLTLGPGYVVRTRSGEVRATLMDGVEAMESYFGRYLPALGNTLIGPVAIMVILLAIDPWLALIALAGGVLAVGGGMLWMAAFAASSDAVWAAIGDTDAEFVDTVQGLPTLKAFNATARRRAFIAERSASHCRTRGTSAGRRIRMRRRDHRSI